jgi:hypothetical protein
MDELDEFALWFVTHGPALGKVPVMSAVATLGHDGKGGNVMSGVWYRKGNFQVELLMIAGPWIIPEHTHPNIDSYQILLGGQIKFSRGGEWLTPETYLVDCNDDGTSPYKGQRIRVNHDDLHGGVVGPGGAIYFSVQHWLNGVEPHCVGLDWNGHTASQEQLDKLKFGSACFVEEKTEQMAVASGML